MNHKLQCKRVYIKIKPTSHVVKGIKKQGLGFVQSSKTIQLLQHLIHNLYKVFMVHKSNECVSNSHMLNLPKHFKVQHLISFSY